MRMSDIFIVDQSGAIIGRGDSYQGLSADSYHLLGTMSLTQLSKFHATSI